MKFSEHTQNASAAKALSGMIGSGKIPHAIMFHEDDGGAAIELVRTFLQNLFCRHREGGEACGECPACKKIAKMIHPDVHFVFPVNTGRSVDYVKEWRELVLSNPSFAENDLTEALEMEGKNAMIKVEESKALLEILSLSALEGGYRAVVVYLPEKMNREAANRLLKMIEEPPRQTQFLFITHAPESVLPTIASRCQHIRVMGGRPAAMAVSPDAQLLRPLMQAVLARDLSAALEAGDALASMPSRAHQRSFCAYAAEMLRCVFLLQQNLPQMVHAAEEDLPFLRDWAARSSKKFPRKALDALSRAQTLIDRNVSQKILFTDLVDRLYLAL